MNDEIEIYEVLFQFDKDEPIRFAFSSEPKFSLVIDGTNTEIPTVTFTNGEGKEFSLMLKKSPNQ